MLTSDYENIDPKLVIIAPDRQRKEFTVDDLLPSIKARGIYNPIIIKRDRTLIAGERRLTAAIQLEMETVPVRYADTMPVAELETIELEENIKRQDLSWQDRANAVLRIHTIYMENESDWSPDKTAALLGVHPRHLYKEIDVAEAILGGDESVAKADSIGAATTLLSRRRSRAADAAVERILTVGIGKSAGAVAQAGPGTVDGNSAGDDSNRSEDAPRVIPPPSFSIINEEFNSWASSYSGQKFNFLHVDFPYGVELNEQANQASFEGEGYDSNPDIYWNLCHQLCENFDQIMFGSCHIMFWISMKFYTETIEFFEENLPKLTFNPTPLIWHKTDGKGIISDALRGPRNIYEACLIGSVGDRKIVRPTNNVYGAPTNKSNAIHTNEKSIPMLEYFMGMFVDEHTRILDPTCGSGSAIRTAERMGAAFGLGLEINGEFAKRAEERLRVERAMRKVTS